MRQLPSHMAAAGRPVFRTLLLLGLAGSLLSASAPGAAALRERSPSLALVVASRVLKVSASAHEVPLVDPGVYVSAVGVAFEVDRSRSSYSRSLEVWQAFGSPLRQRRPLPPGLARGSPGLPVFARLTVVGPNGIESSSTFPFCPNSLYVARVSAIGPTSSTYPDTCAADPFSLGTVWGIDQGWGAAILGGQLVPLTQG